MYVIINKNTSKITQTIDKNYGIIVSKDKILQEVNDDFIKKINTAQDYKLIFEDNKITDIKVLKTWEEWKQEQALNPNILDLTISDDKLAMAEAIVDLNNRILELENKLLEKEGK